MGDMFDDGALAQLDEAEAVVAAFDASRGALVSVAVELCESEGWKRSGSRTLATWLAAYGGLEPPEARRLARLAELCHRHPTLKRALDDGVISYGRAELLAGHAAGIRERHLDPSLPSLLRESQRLHRFDDFASLLNHWCRLVDQDLSAPPREYRNEFHMSQSLFGQGEIHGWLDPELMQVVAAGVHAYTPGPDPVHGPVPPRTLAQRMAAGLGDLAAWGLGGGLPDDDGSTGGGGDASEGGHEPEAAAEPDVPLVKARSGVTANITIDLRTFAGDRRFDDLDGFDLRTDRWTIAHDIAERLLCDAGLVATIFDGHRTLLHATDRSEQFTAAQRRAMAVRDRGCPFPDCDRPPRFCDAHHLVPRNQGGRDDVDNGGLFCRHHHTLLHRGWTIRYDDELHRWIATDPTGIEWHGRPRGSPTID